MIYSHILNFLSYLRDNCIQNFHLGRYIIGYTVGNLVLRRPVSGAVKRAFRTYIRRYTSPNENFEYGYPHSNAILTLDNETLLCCACTSSDASCIKQLASCIYSLVNQWKATIRNDVGFTTVYRRIYCRKFMTLSNQTSHCICKCIRIYFLRHNNMFAKTHLHTTQHHKYRVLRKNAANSVKLRVFRAHF